MFFIMGISQGNKKLSYDQLVICKSCGQYGHIEVYMTYMYLSLFFLPIIKWNRRYYIRMSCCGASCPIDAALGRAIKNGEITELDITQFSFHTQNHSGMYDDSYLSLIHI